MTVGRGLCLQDDRHIVEHAGLTDDLGAVASNPALVGWRGQHGCPAGDRLGQRDLADVVQQCGILQVEYLTLGHAQVLTDGPSKPGHPCCVAGLGVAPELGQPGQCPDRLPIGPADRILTLHGELRQPQREQEQRDRQDAQRPLGQGDQGTGGTQSGGQAERRDELVLECPPEGCLRAGGAHQCKQEHLDRERERRDGHHHQGKDVRAPARCQLEHRAAA